MKIRGNCQEKKNKKKYSAPVSSNIKIGNLRKQFPLSQELVHFHLVLEILKLFTKFQKLKCSPRQHHIGVPLSEW